MQKNSNQSADSEISSSQSQVLLANDLHKSYGPRPALRGLSFSLNAGRVLGFLGPNGAGKTTAIRILTTILEPSAGDFTVVGISSNEPERIRRIIGVLPENLGFPRHITGIEYLTYFGQLYGRTAPAARELGMALLEEVGLQQRAKSLVGTYSHGMRQRLGIARALINHPVVVFLDEPTLGLDPRGQTELLGLVRRIARERGAGVILCSHALSEVESVCDDVVILNTGEVVASGSVSDVIGRARHNLIQGGILRIRVPPLLLAQAQQLLAALPSVVHVRPIEELAGWLRVELTQTDETSSEDAYINNRILEAIIQAEIPILSFEAAGSRLQDVFLQLTEAAIK